jgi:hypothetical protein
MEERISGEWLGPTVGVPSRGIVNRSDDKTTHIAGNGRQEEEEIKSSSLAMEGRTSIAGIVAVELQGVKSAEVRVQREKPHTIAFSEYLFKRKTADLISLLNDLKPNLQKAEGAAIMTSFRSSLNEIWRVAGRLPREKIIVVSAVEEAVRNRKWRELSVGQVEVLERVLSNVNTVTNGSKADLDKAFGAIHGSQIDIYPSAAEDFDDEAEADYDEE